MPPCLDLREPQQLRDGWRQGGVSWHPNPSEDPTVRLHFPGLPILHEALLKCFCL